MGCATWEAFNAKITSYTEKGAQTDYEAIYVAAHLLGAPISILNATELDPTPGGPDWEVQCDSVAGAAWNSVDGQPNTHPDHILLIHFVNHYDAAALKYPDNMTPMPREVTLHQLLREVGEVIAAAADGAPDPPHFWVAPMKPTHVTITHAVRPMLDNYRNTACHSFASLRVAKAAHIAPMLQDLRSLLRVGGSVKMEVAKCYFSLFRFFNYDCGVSSPYDAGIRPCQAHQSFM